MSYALRDEDDPVVYKSMTGMAGEMAEEKNFHSTDKFIFENKNPDSLEDRVLGMLYGVAIGDALGMPTEFLTPERIAAWYGRIEGLVSPHSEHPHHKLPLGSVTDDTDQTLILAQLIIDTQEVNVHEFAKRLLTWSKTPRVLENDFIGPSTQKSLAALGEGVPLGQIPRSGRSVGAAMRVAPIAIAFPDPAQLKKQVVASCEVSHFTRNAISGAMAMAFALGESLQPTADPRTIAKAAQVGAVVGRDYGEWSWAPPIEQRIEHVLSWVETCQEDELLSLMYELIGVDLYPDQLVPCAIGLAVFSRGDPMQAMLLAANLGGDTDTLASMVGSICGGLSGPGGFDKNIQTRVEKTNEIDLKKIAQDLMMVRRGRGHRHE